jgi:hypothetical protein
MERKFLMREADKVKREVQLLNELSETLSYNIQAVECGICTFEEFVERIEETFIAIGERYIEIKGVSSRQYADECLRAAMMSTSGPSIN